MADESFFTTQTPATYEFDATGLSLGTTFRFALAGVVKGIRYYTHTNLTGGTYTGGLYSVDTQDGGTDPGTGTGTSMASATFGTLTADSWNTVLFGIPVAVAANTPYRAVGYSSVGRYVTGGTLFSSDATNGNITAIADHSSYAGKTIFNGTYNYATGISYPNDTFNATAYFIDVIYEANAVTLYPPRRRGPNYRR